MPDSTVSSTRWKLVITTDSSSILYNYENVLEQYTTLPYYLYAGSGYIKFSYDMSSVLTSAYSNPHLIHYRFIEVK